MYPGQLTFDLLLGDVYRRLLSYPEQFREIVLANDPQGPVIVDEVQRLPELLNEIHWLIENKGYQFILSGSSPRKIIRRHVNLLGGRALRFELYPLSWCEIPQFDLVRAINHGLMPRHYDAENPQLLLSSYIGNYLESEIAAETRIRNVDVFARFLEKAAFSNGEIVNYTNIAADCRVSSPTVREYFQILVDTLLGDFVDPFRKKPKRRIVAAPKFYYFDIGIANALLKRSQLQPSSPQFGSAFEHFIYQELKAHRHYSTKSYTISYWRTSSGFEVDFILGDHQVAIEIKSTGNVTSRHLKGLNAFSEEYNVEKKIVVSLESAPRKVGNILILPWKDFLSRLWENQIM